MGARHVLLEKYCQDTGYTVEAFRKKVERGDLVAGVHYDNEGDRKIKVDTEAMSLWARGVPTNVIQAWKQEEIRSVYASISGGVGRKRSSSNPPPLTLATSTNSEAKSSAK